MFVGAGETAKGRVLCARCVAGPVVGLIYRRGRDLAGLADAGSATHEPFELEAEGTEGMV